MLDEPRHGSCETVVHIALGSLSIGGHLSALRLCPTQTAPLLLMLSAVVVCLAAGHCDDESAAASS